MTLAIRHISLGTLTKKGNQMEYEKLTLNELKNIAKEKGIKGLSGLKKSDIIELLKMNQNNTRDEVKQEQTQTEPSNLNKEEKQTSYYAQENIQSGVEEKNTQPEKPIYWAVKEEPSKDETTRRLAYQKSFEQGRRTKNNGEEEKDISELDSGITVQGILEVMPEGFGFIRSANYLPGDNDVYVSPSQIRRFSLKTGDILEGNTRIKTQNEKFSALLYITNVNGENPLFASQRKSFEELTPIFPNERIHLDYPHCPISMRIMDLVAPIGKGQRGMIVAPPKVGKTTLLKQIATSISKNYKDIRLIVLLIDERPEEVTDIREAIEGENVEVIYSTFDESPEHHKRVSEMVIERAKRLVEHKTDVVILLDSITRLARAYNLVVPTSGRVLSGGLDPAALQMPKRFFGAARNMREGGSLTVLATALVETGSRMDEVVFEEFKGTGNMELVLDRGLSERRIFPAVDLARSSTRRDELLLQKDEQETMELIRRELSGEKKEDAISEILKLFSRTSNNNEFMDLVHKSLGRR